MTFILGLQNDGAHFEPLRWCRVFSHHLIGQSEEKSLKCHLKESSAEM